MNLTVSVVSTDFSTESPLVVDAGGISINGNVNGAGASTLVQAVTDGESADIIITQTGYYPYTMTIDDVFMADATVTIIMVAVVSDISDADYLRPRPSLFTFIDPCSFAVSFYSASSYGGDVTWYVNNEVYIAESALKGVSYFCAPGEYQIKVRNQTYDYVSTNPACPPTRVPAWDNYFSTTQEGSTVISVIGDSATYLAADVTTNVTVVEYRPELTFDVTPDNEPFADEDVTYYTRGSSVVVTPNVQLNRPGALPEDHTITWQVVDPEGITVPLLQEVFPLNLPAASIAIEFTLDKLGVYAITATIDDMTCGTSFVRNLNLETYNFVSLNYNGCNEFEITNRSSDTEFSYSISDISDPTVIASGTLTPGRMTTASFSTPSMYRLDVTYERDGVVHEELYLLNNYCALERCFISYIEGILCGDIDRCSPCPPESDLNQMFLLYNTYFMKVNKLFKVNSYFEALDEEGLAEITTLDQVMGRILAFCQRSGCVDSTFVKNYGEGPYDWLGQGSNIDKSCSCSTPTQASAYNISKPGYCSTCN
tara:strand:+ start:241 stop:1860 length:1620 start_codon:yes stop_codon:yes gene_type:complete